MRGRAAVAAAAAVLAVAAALTGCGPDGSAGSGGTETAAVDRTGPSPSPAALTVTGVSPDPGAGRLPPTAALTVRFSAPLAAGSPTPTLSPALPGHWARTAASTLTFTPDRPYAPDADVTLTVPAGAAGPHSRSGATLAAPTAVTFRGPQPSYLRAQQILARLRYLPLAVDLAQPRSAARELAAAYDPPAASFSWRWDDVPATLRQLWAPGTPSVLTTGAVMAFQHDHGLTMDGLLGQHTWDALLAADLAGQVSPRPYSYVSADLRLPQQLSVWVDGAVVLTSPVNSGIAGARTTLGTFPVYYRREVMTMSGTNPDGTHYSDPGVPWSSFFHGGEAVHGFPRAHYGYPQSVGCLELPVATADRVYHLVDYGTLVTVSGDPTAHR